MLSEGTQINTLLCILLDTSIFENLENIQKCTTKEMYLNHVH